MADKKDVIEDVPFTEVKDEKKKSQGVDFASEEDVKSHISQPVKDTTSSSNAETDSKSNSEPITQKSIADAEKKFNEAFDEKEASRTATFLITAFDTGMRMLFKFISKDSNASDDIYRIADRDKSDLSGQLTIILIKYQAKFPIAFIFLLTLLAVYSTGFQRAMKQRQLVNDYKKVYKEKIEEKLEEKGVKDVEDLSNKDISETIKKAKDIVVEKDIESRATKKAKKATTIIPDLTNDGTKGRKAYST